MAQQRQGLGITTMAVDFGKRVDNTAYCVVEMFSVPLRPTCDRCDAPVSWHQRIGWWCGNADSCTRTDHRGERPLVMKARTHYDARALRRIDLNTPYTVQVQRLAKIYRNAQKYSRKMLLVVDCTGVGEGPTDSLLAEGIPLVPIYLSSGERLTPSFARPYDEIRATYGKAALAGRISRILGERRIHLPQELPHAKPGEMQIVMGQLEGFGVKIDEHSGYESFEGLGTHDDYVIAIAMAVTIERHLHATWRRAAKNLLRARKRRLS